MIQMKRIPYGDHGDGFNMPELDYDILKLYIADHIQVTNGSVTLEIVRFVQSQIREDARWKAMAIVALAMRELKHAGS